MSARIASRVFGTEILMSLIWHYRKNPGSTQLDARTALDLNQPTVSFNIRLLLDAAVLFEQEAPEGADKRSKFYRVDEQRVRELLEALSKYLLED